MVLGGGTMCGICGIFDSGASSLDQADVAVMSQRLARRGPDDQGLHADGPVVLGHRRLSILDLSSAGHQPLPSHCGRY